MSENNSPVFSIEKIYVKDLSVEVPNAPQIFLERQAPAIEVQLSNAAQSVDDGIFEVALTVTVTAKLPEDKTVFLIEVTQAGIFQIRNVPAEEMEPVLAIGCPNILFPYARETISDATTRAGFQAVLLAPVNFEAIYQSRNESAQTAQ